MNAQPDHRRPETDDADNGTDAFEHAFKKAGHPDDVEDNRDRTTEKKIDKASKDSFPASDPPSAMPGAD